MDEKTEKDCNGIEGELFSKIKSGDYSWIPMRRSKKIGFLLKLSIDRVFFLYFFRIHSRVFWKCYFR